MQEENSKVASKLLVGNKEYELVFTNCEDLATCTQVMYKTRRKWCSMEKRWCVEILVYVTVGKSTDNFLQK